MKIWTRTLVVALGLAVLLSGAVPRLTRTLESPASATPALSDLQSVEELKTLFNRDQGKPRLVLLLSPT